jgi:tRNA(Ile)-lysidine synthase
MPPTSTTAADPFLSRAMEGARRLIPPGSTVLVAVSGGADSTALFRALDRLRETLGIERIGIAHVNHGLRGAESDGDEAFVRRMAADAGVACHAAVLTEKTGASSGIEEWARRERYAFFARLRQDHGYSVVATAHTMDDQAETVLLRILRGTGIRGLSGIRPHRDDGVVRPLLETKRATLLSWLEREGVAFRTDSSNTDRRYKRNWIRHEVLPRLVAQEPDALRLIASCATACGAIRERLDPIANKWERLNVVERSPDRLVVHRDALCPGALPAYALTSMLESAGIATDRGHIASLVRPIQRTGATHLLPGGWHCTVRRDTMEFARGSAVSRRGDGASLQVPLLVPGTTRCEESVEIAAEMVPVEATHDGIVGDNTRVFLDAASVGDDLVYRVVRTNDEFRALGSDVARNALMYLKKQGIEETVRHNTAVVAKPSGDIVWVPGVQIAHECRIRSETRDVVVLTIRSVDGR